MMGEVYHASMARTPEEKEKSYGVMPMAQTDIPHGCCICLTEIEIEKLGLTGECSVGDMLELEIICKVTAVHSGETAAGKTCRVELEITHMGIDDDYDEPEDEAAEAPKENA